MDANEPNVLNNYAVFLSECRNDTAAAEEMSALPSCKTSMPPVREVSVLPVQPLSGKYGTDKTVKARIWPLISG